MVMPLGLINAHITYKGMVNKLFVDVIKNTMEAYTDDMLVKFKIGVDLQRPRASFCKDENLQHGTQSLQVVFDVNSGNF